MKRWLISKFNGNVISCYKNKTGAIFKTCVFCLSSLINALMPDKKESFIPQRYAWKTLCSSKTLLVTHGKFYLWRELLLLSHNAKYYIKSLERNKMKLFDIRGLWKKKKYSEENTVLIHWQILQLLILILPVGQVSQKKMTIILR